MPTPIPSMEDLSRAHALMLNALADIDAACRGLDIEYWIDSGTLLGAVRNGTFIPWDDDIDLCMTRDNLDRFAAEAPALLSSLHSIVLRSDDPIIGVDAKIYISGTHVRTREESELGIPPTHHDGLFVDILVADSLSTSPRIRKIERSIAWLTDTRPWASSRVMATGLTLKTRTRWTFAALTPRWVIAAVRGRLVNRLRLREDALVGIGTAALYNGYPYPRDVIYPLSEITFEGLRVPAPAHVHEYLRNYYGESYLTPPPPESRTTHYEAIWFDDHPSSVKEV